MIYHYKLSTKLEIINWKNKVRYLVAKMIGSSEPSQMERFAPRALQFSHTNEKFIRPVTGVKRKVSLCDTPPLALYSSDNINSNIQKNAKEVLKHLSKKQNKNMSLKQLAVTCLSKFDREMLLSRSEIQLQQQQVFKTLTFMVKSFTLDVS